MLREERIGKPVRFRHRARYGDLESPVTRLRSHWTPVWEGDRLMLTGSPETGLASTLREPSCPTEIRVKT